MKNNKSLIIMWVCIAVIVIAAVIAIIIVNNSGGPPAALPGTTPAAASTRASPHGAPAASPGTADPSPAPAPSRDPVYGFVGSILSISGNNVSVQVLPIPIQEGNPAPTPAAGSLSFAIPDGVPITKGDAAMKFSDLKTGDIIIVYYGSDGKAVEKVMVSGNLGQ